MSETPDTKPFDRKDLLNCCSCDRGIMATGDIHFYEVTIGQCIADLPSIRQQHGLEMMMGRAAPLASVFAPTTNVAHRLPTKRVLICSECALHPQNLMVMMED
jgi:hypothetical protein